MCARGSTTEQVSLQGENESTACFRLSEKKEEYYIKKLYKPTADSHVHSVNIRPLFYGRDDPLKEKFNTKLRPPRKAAVAILLKYGIVMN